MEVCNLYTLESERKSEMLADMTYLTVKPMSLDSLIRIWQKSKVHSERFVTKLNMSEQSLNAKVLKANMLNTADVIQLHYDGAYNEGYVLVYGNGQDIELITTADRLRWGPMLTDDQIRRIQTAHIFSPDGIWLGGLLHLYGVREAYIQNLDFNWRYRDHLGGVYYTAEGAFSACVKQIDKFKLTGLSGEVADRLFDECKIKELDLSEYDTSELKSAWSMFRWSEIPKIDFSKCDLSNLENANSMFEDSYTEEIDFGMNKFERLSTCRNMFSQTKNLRTVRLTHEAHKKIEELTLRFDKRGLPRTTFVYVD